MKNVITILYGTKYTADDVHYIYEKSKNYNHICIVDELNSKDLNDNIEQIPIHNEEGYWEKIKLFQNDWKGDCLYLDLDVIIQENLDKLFSYCKKPTICQTYWKHYGGKYNSSVMAWKGNDAKYIYDYFEKQDQYYMTKYLGDDRFLYHENMFSNVFPKGLIYSFEFGVDFTTDVSPRGFKIHQDYTIALLNGERSKEELRKKYYDALSLHKMG